MRMQFGITAFERAEGDLPELPVINMFAEEAPTEETGIVLQSRPPLVDRSANMGTGPVQQLFKRDGVLAGALFGVSGGTLYEGTLSLGLIPGSGPVSMAGNEIGLAVAAGAEAQYFDGMTLAPVAFPDGAAVAQVFNGASRLWMIRKDTGKLYFTPALSATVDGLDFITAESLPDKLLHGLWLDDAAVLFGAESVEFWPNTGDPVLPIEPLEGRVFEEGIRATGCATVWDATFAWVTSDHRVCLPGTKPEPISNPGLEKRIKDSVACRLWTFELEGQEFLALTIDAGTWVYGNRNRLWSQFQTYAGDAFAAQCWAGGVFGSATDGKTVAFGTGHLELGAELERRFRAGFPLNSGGLAINSILIRANTGQTPYLTGNHIEPVVEMRLSRDAGQTWGVWKRRSLGTAAQYRKRVEWRAQGMASQPGLLAEFRLTSPVPFRVSDVLVNENRGGR